MTPGHYLKLRREAASIGIDGTVVEPDVLASLEGGQRFPTDIELQALRWAFPFDVAC